MAADGDLPERLQQLVIAANARSGKVGKRSVSAGSLRRWRSQQETGGEQSLVPEESRKARRTPPDWMARFLVLYRIPSKPSISACYEHFRATLPVGMQLPSLRQVQRGLKTISEVEVNRGRMGPRELKALKTYVARDVADLWPGAVYVSDGHCFDAEIAHPAHGRPFRPEITAIIDVYTRRVTGWSAALSENTLGVMDAARHAFESSGLCDIWYVDNGSGFNNDMMDAEMTGFLARMTVTKHNSLPYNSQARGVIERAHQSLWVRAAKTLPTYIGADMDREARQRAFKATRQDIKHVGASPLLMAWPDFLEFCSAVVDGYNNRPHTTLRKVRDPETGKLRHMSPIEAWAEGCAQHGEPDLLTEAESLDLSRPQERRKTTRGLVKLFGNEYFSRELEDWYGEEVLVGYDIHDASKVWVRNLEQQLICVAEFEGNKASFFPVSAVEAAKTRRLQGRLKRLEAHREEIEAEASPGILLEHSNEQPLDPIEIAEAAETVVQLMTAQETPQAEARTMNGRPIFDDELDLTTWLLSNPDRVTESDKRLLRTLLRNSLFRMQLDSAGLDATALEQLTLKETA
jgi:putative transposase